MGDCSHCSLLKATLCRCSVASTPWPRRQTSETDPNRGCSIRKAIRPRTSGMPAPSMRVQQPSKMSVKLASLSACDISQLATPSVSTSLPAS